MLLSRSIDEENFLNDVFDGKGRVGKLRKNFATISDTKTMTVPDVDLQAETWRNPMLLKKFPEQEIENINIKSRFMLIADETEGQSLTSSQYMPSICVNANIESYNTSRAQLNEIASARKLRSTIV